MSTVPATSSHFAMCLKTKTNTIRRLLASLGYWLLICYLFFYFLFYFFLCCFTFSPFTFSLFSQVLSNLRHVRMLIFPSALLEPNCRLTRTKTTVKSYKNIDAETDAKMMPPPTVGFIMPSGFNYKTELNVSWSVKALKDSGDSLF